MRLRLSPTKLSTALLLLAPALGCSRLGCDASANGGPSSPVLRLGLRCGSGPALTASDETLYVAWKGGHDDDTIWWTFFDGDVWVPQDMIGPVVTSSEPALAVLRKRLYCAWKGGGDDQGIWYATLRDGAWREQEAVPDVATNAGPALAEWRDALYLAWRGANDDTGIWWSTFDGEAWAPQRSVEGVATDRGPALAAWNDHLYMAWKAPDGPQIWWTSFDGTAWGPQTRAVGVETDMPPALAGGKAGLYLAWKGATRDPTIAWPTADGQDADNDTSIRWARFDGHAFGPARSSAEGRTSTRPGLAVRGQDLLAAWKGEGSDGNVYLSGLGAPRARKAKP